MDISFESPEELREVVVNQHRQLETLRREVDDADLLVRALKALLDVDGDVEPFANVFAVLAPVLRFSHALVLVESEAPSGELYCVVSTAPELANSSWPANRLFEKALSGRVTATVARGSDAGWPDVAVAAGIGPDQPALYLPVGFRDRRGLLMLVRPAEQDGFDRRDIAIARKLSLLASQAFAARVANRSERERRRLHELTEELRTAQAALDRRANHDQLTGLPNRACFEELMTEALQRAEGRHRLALAFIDLDGFKQVNDHYGHEAGDLLLSGVAQRLREHARAGDVLARISGDEFVMLIDPVAETGCLDAIVERMLTGLKEPFAVGKRNLMVSASIGLAVFPEHGTDYEMLRRNADMAMYSAKTASPGTAAYFDSAIGHAAASRSGQEQQLRRAVGDGRFRCVLQPKVDLRTMRITGFEALARRVDEDGTVGGSADFVELATRLGLLDEITDLVLDDVLRVMPALDATFGTQTSMSVNVSTRQATDPVRMPALLERLARSDRSRRFVFEVTEDAFMQAGVFESQILPLLAEHGVRVSIDDFGAGYASLSRLLNVTADEVKIDRAFITAIHERPRSQVIMRALATAGQELGICVVAEGVEQLAEMEYLLEHTMITTAQGHLFAAPALPETLIAEAGCLQTGLACMARRLPGPVERIGTAFVA